MHYVTARFRKQHVLSRKHEHSAHCGQPPQKKSNLWQTAYCDSNCDVRLHPPKTKSLHSYYPNGRVDMFLMTTWNQDSKLPLRNRKTCTFRFTEAYERYFMSNGLCCFHLRSNRLWFLENGKCSGLIKDSHCSLMSSIKDSKLSSIFNSGSLIIKHCWCFRYLWSLKTLNCLWCLRTRTLRFN